MKINRIITGDALELSKDIPDGSVDLIFTDPPYSKKYLPLYYGIIEEAARVLAPHGFLLLMTGGYWKDEIMARARKKLSFFWDFPIWEPQNSPVNWPRRVICRNKNILVYHLKEEKPLPFFNVLSVWLGGGEDKKYHVWGQDESTARYYIAAFSRPGDLVLDYCVGGGTYPHMASLMGRNYLGFEIDPDVAEGARQRIELYPMEPIINKKEAPREPGAQLSLPEDGGG